MARGKAKIDAKIKANKKIDAAKRHGSELAAQQKGKKFACKLCMVPAHNMQSLKDHYAAKHPKASFDESDFA